MSLPSGISLSEIPLIEPPTGVTANFINPPSLAPAVVAISVVLILWTLFFVVIRLYMNVRASRPLGIDDYFCVLATILALSYTGLIISLNKFARHSYDIPLSWIDGDYFKREYSQNMILVPTISFAKGAILLFYLRVFTIDRKMRFSIWLGLTMTFVIYWITIPFVSWNCAPRAGDAWSIQNIEAQCQHQVTFYIVQGVLSLVLDLYIFILPIPILLRLQMSLQRRLAVLGIFGTAFLGIIAAVLGLVYRIKMRTTHNDFWTIACLFICISCENYVAIIVSSMPSFAAFSRDELPNISRLIATLCSRFFKFSYPESRSKIGTSQKPILGVHSSQESTKLGSHPRDNGYLELQDSRHRGEYDLGSVRTEIRGMRALTETVQEGVVYKSVSVYQSMKLERPVV